MPVSEAVAYGGALRPAASIGWYLRVGVASLAIPPLLEVVSFSRIERWLLTAARIRVSRPPDDALAAWWVDRILWRLPPPWRNTCLRRASVLFYLLHSAGHPVELCIGVRRDGRGELLAHAWLLKDGVLYLEPPAERDFISGFREIARFPQRRLDAGA